MIIWEFERHTAKKVRELGALALSIYNCFLTHWPNSAVPASEQRWLTGVRVGGHCRSFKAFGFHSDPSAKAIYCILLIPGVCTLLNYNYNSRWEHCLSAACPPLIHLQGLLLCFSLYFCPQFSKRVSSCQHEDTEYKSCIWWIIDECAHLGASLQYGSWAKRWG